MYKVILLLPNPDTPHLYDAHNCQLRTVVTRRWGFFGPQSVNVGVEFVGDDIKPLTKEDADFTARLVYLTYRRAGAQVKVEEV